MLNRKIHGTPTFRTSWRRSWALGSAVLLLRSADLSGSMIDRRNLQKRPCSVGGICLKLNPDNSLPISFTSQELLMRVHPPEKRAQMALEDVGYTWRDMAVKVEREVQMGKIHRGFQVCVCTKARKNIIKGKSLTYLLKQDSSWENVRYVL